MKYIGWSPLKPAVPNAKRVCWPECSQVCTVDIRHGIVRPKLHAPLSRGWHRAVRRRKPGASGRMYAMTGTQAIQRRPQRVSIYSQIGRESILSNIFAIILACSRTIPLQAMTDCPTQSVREAL